jgi:hypothetical protein
MKTRYFLTALLSLAVWAGAQNSAPQPSTDPTVSGAGQLHKESNAASATKDTSATSGDQVTKPSGAAKNTTVIGCLRAADAEGHLMLNSMQFRSGVEVLGPSDLSSAAGQKVKLTGSWVPAQEADQGGKKKERRFQATSFDVLAEKCPPPAETSPVSKKKQQQQKAAAQADSVNNPK